MSPTPGHNRKDSWRNSSGGGSWNRGATQRSWRSPDTTPPSEEGFFARLRERGFFRFFTSACAAVLCITAIIWILQLPGCTNTDLWLVTYTPDHRGIAPPKAFFPNQRAAVEKLREEPRYSGRTVSWEEAGTRLKETDRDKVLVLYVAGHAVEIPADDGSRRTEIMLLPDNTDPDNRADYRPLRDLWSALRNNCDPRQKKLVLLDLFDLHDHWRLGLFHSAMRSDLESAIEGIRNLVVVTGCSPLQRSWAADSLDGGQSVFGHFALRGLQGDADRTGDGQMQLGELVEFLATRTDQWVRRNRDRNGQQPLRFSTVDDASANEWVIVSRARGSEEAGTDGDAAPPEATEVRIERAWNRRGELAERYPQGPYQSAPLQWRALTERLIEAETWADAGHPSAAAEIISDAENRANRLEAAIKTSRFEDDAFRKNAPFVYDSTVRRLRAPPEGWSGGGDPGGGGGAPERFRGETTGPLKLPETYLQEELFAHLPPENATAKNLSGEFFNLRRQAEFAAGWSLETLDPVRSLLTEADRRRRFGEDYLFIGDTENARAYLAAAQEQYDTIIEIRSVLNRASSVRNTTFADLYYLADWSAHRHPHPESDFRAGVMRIYQAAGGFRPGSGELAKLDPSGQARASDDITRFNRDCNAIEIAVLRLLETARQLDEHLFEVKEFESARDEDLLHLATLAENAAEQHKTVRDGLQRLASEAIARDPDQPNLEYWHPLRDLLRLPFFDGETRRNLRNKAADFSRTMQRNTTDEAPPAATQTSDEDEAFAGSEWSTFWAIQALSLGPQDWATLQNRGTGYTLDDLQQQWKALRAAEVDEKPWLLVRLGDALRQAWRAKRDKVDSILKGWPDENASVDPAEIAELRRQLSEADRLARTLHPWDARRLDDAAADPALQYNRFLMADLLHTHAGRYLEDFYAGWYSRAAQDCLGAVDNSMKSVFAAARRSAGETKQQREQARITLTELSTVAFDSRRQGTVRPAVEAMARLPAGFVAFWLDLQGLTADVAASPPHRRAIDTTRQGAVDLPPFELTWNPQPQLAGKTENASLRTFFRGHLWQTPVPLHLRLPGTTTVKYTPPAGPATVVLRGVDRRPIMFVLDGSGSMIHDRNRIGGKTRFQVAKETLLAALEGIRASDQNDPQLHRNPTEAGLILFLKNNDTNRYENPVLAPVQPLTDDHYATFREQLAKYNDTIIAPEGNTPLLKAMREGLTRIANRSGVIVAVTDGGYTDDAEFQSLKREIRAFQQNGHEIETHIVGFQVQPGSDEDRKLQTLRTDPVIRADVIIAGNVEQLLARLREATRKRPYKVVGPRLPDGGIEQVLNRTVELKPGENFRIAFGALQPIPFDIRGGEALEFLLGPQGREIRHGKPDLRPNVVPAQSPDREDPRTYSLGYRTYELTRGKQARFELLLIHDENQAAVPHPEEITFVIRPEKDRGGDSSERSFAWKPLAGVSVPGWEVTIEDWPVESRPPATIQVYWKLKRTPPDREIPLTELSDGRTKSISLPATDKPELPYLLAASWRGDAVEIDLQVADADGGGTQQVLPEDLARMKIQLARRDPGSGNWSPADLPFTSDHITEEGRRTVTLEQIPPGFAAQDWAVLVTSWKSLRDRSYQLQRELVAERPTNFQ